jgi:1-acyl-sn-glycerol-3-phosphate acyltransferase
VKHKLPLTVVTWLVLGLLEMALSPVLLALAGLASAVTGDRRPLIFIRVLTAYFAYEVGAMAACGALWLAGGRRRLNAHWRLLRWFVGGLAGQISAALEITVDHESSPEADAALRADGPVLVFSRHAGPGDTILLADRLLAEFDRQPSVVFKEALAVDPSIDLLGHRLPHAVLDTSDRHKCESQIARVTGQLGARGALMLFPEGGNFTEERRRSALTKLRRKGRRREAERADGMPHVLPPHPTGVLCALDANPRADIIFAAHAGLGLAASPGALWRDMPIGRTLRTRMWLVPADEVPHDDDARTKWLYDWWERIDEWLSSGHQL